MRILIISGGRFSEEFVASYFKQNTYDRVIVADYGALYAKRLGIVPDIMVGDFDTLGENEFAALKCEFLAQNSELCVIKCDPVKDDTDTEIAVRTAIDECRNSDLCNAMIDIICGTGGRIDHLLGNIHVLKMALDSGIRARIIDEKNIVELFDKDFILRKNECPHKYISLIPLGDEVRGIRIEGSAYDVKDLNLMMGISRGISNEFAADTIKVSLVSGVLIVVNSGD